MVSQEQETRLGDIDLSELQRSGIVLVRHGKRPRRAISIAAPYCAGVSRPKTWPDYLEYGTHVSRAFRTLKVTKNSAEKETMPCSSESYSLSTGVSVI
jgi:hypothetical protein